MTLILFQKMCLTLLKKLVIFIITLFKVSPMSLKSLATAEQIALVNSLKLSLVPLCRKECRTLCKNHKNNATVLPFYSCYKKKKGIQFHF